MEFINHYMSAYHSYITLPAMWVGIGIWFPFMFYSVLKDSKKVAIPTFMFISVWSTVCWLYVW